MTTAAALPGQADPRPAELVCILLDSDADRELGHLPSFGQEITDLFHCTGVVRLHQLALARDKQLAGRIDTLRRLLVLRSGAAAKVPNFGFSFLEFPFRG